jgi:hypothetical protein
MLWRSKYPQLHQLFGAYLNQDCGLWGDTLEEVIACYKRDSSPEDLREMQADIDRFIESHAEKLDATFEYLYGNDFDPELWGMTTASFFAELKRILQD